MQKQCRVFIIFINVFDCFSCISLYSIALLLAYGIIFGGFIDYIKKHPRLIPERYTSRFGRLEI